MCQHGKQCGHTKCVRCKNAHHNNQGLSKERLVVLVIIKESDTYFDNHNNDGEIAYTTMATVKTHSLISIYIQNTISFFKSFKNFLFVFYYSKTLIPLIFKHIWSDKKLKTKKAKEFLDSA